MQQKDFYLNKRGLAAYVEKDWFDHILNTHPHPLAFEFAPFPPSKLYSSYHEDLVKFLVKATVRAQLKPRTLFEIGASLGRTFYEICKQTQSLENATLVEPSKNLYSLLTQILKGEEFLSVPILKGNLELAECRFDVGPIRTACAGVRVRRKNSTFQDLRGVRETHDLVICSNVIDQCHDHLELAEFLKHSTAPGGVLLLSCTYQWDDKYIGNAPIPIKDINQFFDSHWKCLGETNLPFHVRVYERYWKTFLSHVVAYQRTSFG